MLMQLFALDVRGGHFGNPDMAEALLIATAAMGLESVMHLSKAESCKDFICKIRWKLF